MRKIRRLPLPSRATAFLARKQSEVVASNARSKWKASRATKTMRRVLEVLTQMAGPRARCMFCGDSRGADIDHFWPVVPHFRRTFLWENLLLVCTACNRCKGNRFVLDGRGSPLLIDPTVDNPWDSLYFDSTTGIVTFRFSLEGVPNPRGRHTTDPDVLPLNIEAITEGRRRVGRKLRRAVIHFLDGGHSVQDRTRILLETLRDTDDYGLGHWYFERDGANEHPFANLKSQFPDVWRAVIQLLSGD